MFVMQVSEPSCIIDLRRVPPGVGRAGLQALIFPVSTRIWELTRSAREEGLRTIDNTY